jgi:hypothetical protein
MITETQITIELIITLFVMSSVVLLAMLTSILFLINLDKIRGKDDE